MPFVPVPRSIESKVVGRVLAVFDLKVCGSETKEEEDRDGTGDEGEVGGIGLIEASSSASPVTESFQEEIVDLRNEMESS